MFWVSIPLKVGIFAGMAGIYHMCEPHPGDPGPTSLSSWKKPVVWCKRKAVLLSYLLNLLGIIIVQSPDPHPFHITIPPTYLGECPLGFDAAYLSPRLVFGEHLQNPPHLYNGWSGVHFFPSIFLQPKPGIGQDYSWDFLPCFGAGNPGNPPAKITRWSIEVGYCSVWLWSLVVGAGLARGFWPSQALVAWRNHMLTG